MPIIVAANNTSAMKSRSLTASIEFGDSASNPSVPWIRMREIGYAHPATAPEPSGRTAAERCAARRRARSRSSGQKCESSQCAPDTGMARCRCVYDGISAVSSVARLLQHYALQSTNGAVELLADIDRPQPRGRGHLIVTAASRVQLRRDVADLIVQESVDERVHVLVGGLRLLTGVQARRNGIETLLDRFALLERKHARAPERNGPRLRQPYVVRPEPEVDADRVVQRIELRRGAGAEPAAPELVRSLLGLGRGRCSHIDVRHRDVSRDD